MKRLIIIIAILLLAAGGYLLAAHLTGGALPTFGLALGGERQVVREKTLKFWEDLKFKDLKSAAALLPPDKQDTLIIVDFLNHIFHATPDVLDIVDYSIVSAELDSTGQRVRIKTNVNVNNLASKKLSQTDVMLFFYQAAQGRWYLDLTTSF